MLRVRRFVLSGEIPIISKFLAGSRYHGNFPSAGALDEEFGFGLISDAAWPAERQQRVFVARAGCLIRV